MRAYVQASSRRPKDEHGIEWIVAKEALAYAAKQLRAEIRQGEFGQPEYRCRPDAPGRKPAVRVASQGLRIVG
jgi:hypothetical protein